MPLQHVVPEDVISDLRELFGTRGNSMYGGEAVTQLEHGLQAAHLAECEGAAPDLIVSALLHDIGHLLHDLPQDAPDDGVDDVHENLGASWLADRFPDAVVEPVRLHVAAKRYLCAVDQDYRASLSPPSELSLQLQGGPMTAEECESFERQPYYSDAVRLRWWDDKAKIVGLACPAFEHYLPQIRAALAVPAA
jgi:phosphonate degradation associated HDIG domain protein